MTRRVLLGILAGVLVVIAVLSALLLRTNGASSSGNPTLPRPFAWLAQTSQPVGWTRLVGAFPLGGLPLPPGFRAVPGDHGTLTAALVGPGGAYLGYLNATPIEAGERLQGWPAFRLDHLRDDDALSARGDAAVQQVRTGTARRSCVIDDYVTRVGTHHFHEVACVVEQRTAASVIVAATPSGDPARVWPVLERAVAAYPLDRP